MELVLLKWNGERIKVLPKFPKLQKVMREFNAMWIKDKRKRAKKGMALYLTDGVNNIPAEYWKECKKHKTIQADIAEGRIEEIVETVENKDSQGKTKKETVVEYGKLSAKKKEKLIEETFDIRSLQLFLDQETSDTLRLKLTKRIDGVNTGDIQENIGKPKSHVKTGGK